MFASPQVVAVSVSLQGNIWWILVHTYFVLDVADPNVPDVS